MRELKFFRGNHRIGHQRIVLAAHLHGAAALPLPESDSQRFAQMQDAFLHVLRETLSALGIDDLNDADQVACFGLRDRRHQHLLGTVARFSVNRLQEIQLGTVRLEFHFVVHIANIDHALIDRDKSGNRLLIDRKFDVLERIQTDLDLGNDRTFIFAGQIYREPVGKKQAAQLRRKISENFIDVL